MAVIDRIKKLTRQLLPTGRAFKMPKGGEFEKLMNALAESEERVYQDGLLLLDSVLPDNDNFDEDDAQAWEMRLGLITNSSVPLADRKSAIRRKMNHPGPVKPRQHWRFLQAQLQLAGFDVYVHENLSRIDPLTLVSGSVQLGDAQLGDSQLGGYVPDRIANSITSEGDIDFESGLTVNFSNLFIVGGSTVGTTASVDSDRETEFRQLVLKLKPVNQVALLLINYT